MQSRSHWSLPVSHEAPCQFLLGPAKVTSLLAGPQWACSPLHHRLTWASREDGQTGCRRRQGWHRQSRSEHGGWAPGGTGWRRGDKTVRDGSQKSPYDGHSKFIS